jgi:hypothetical protein
MNSPRVGLRVAALIFGIVCLGHLWRALAHINVRLGAYDVPEWPSLVAVIASGLLTIWLWRLSTKRDGV